MKASVLTDVGSVEVQERSRPDGNADEVIVAVDACGVCMTDYHMYEGRFQTETPVVLGHESAGTVIEVGEDVKTIQTGDEVVLYPAVPCGVCPDCVHGRQNHCANLVGLGAAADEVRDGSFAEYVAAPEISVIPREGLPVRTAVFAEPLGCCIHGVDRTTVQSGDTVVIIGAGPIGLLLVQTFRNTGVGEIVVSELRPERRECALDLGADHVVNPRDGNPVDTVDDLVDSVDVAVEAVGARAALEQAWELTGENGEMLVFGVPPEDESMEISPFDVFYQEIDVLGSFASTPSTMRRAVTLLREGRIDVDPIITGELELDGVPTAFEQMGNAEGLKKIIYPKGIDESRGTDE